MVVLNPSQGTTMKFTLNLMAASAALALSLSAQAGEVEVLHWWTSGGEAKAAQGLKASLQAKGHTWKDFAVAGGGGDSAMTVLKSRVVSGNAPAAAQIKGPSIQEWAREGLLQPMDEVAKAENWDGVLPKVVSDIMKYQGHYVAAPVNVHRVNWLWANAEVLKKAGVKAAPTNWDEFFVAAEALKKVGVIPLARRPVLAGLHRVRERGAGRRRRRLLSQGAGAAGPGHAGRPHDGQGAGDLPQGQVLHRQERPGRDWNLATAMVIKGEAGMQLMGDWAKGEFIAAGKRRARTSSAPPPRARPSLHLQHRQPCLFKLKDKANQQAQRDFASAVMSPNFQELFNLNKGSSRSAPT
jgi:glucose/mannose transport system substrate-binding protein